MGKGTRTGSPEIEKTEKVDGHAAEFDTGHSLGYGSKDRNREIKGGGRNMPYTAREPLTGMLGERAKPPLKCFKPVLRKLELIEMLTEQKINLPQPPTTALGCCEGSYRNTQCSCRKCNREKGAQAVGQLRLFG